MINITPESKRAGWRLDEIIYNRLVELTKEYNVSLEEAGNITLGVADEYEVEQALKVYAETKQQRMEYRKRAFKSLAHLDITMLDQLSSLSGEDLSELLGQRSPATKAQQLSR
jgi:hypothetical protein